MIGKKSEFKKFAHIYEVEKIIGSIDGPKSFEQERVYEHIKKLSPNMKTLEKIRANLDKLEMLNEKTIEKLIEILPKDEKLLKQMLINEKRTFTEEEIKKILSVIKGE